MKELIISHPSQLNSLSTLPLVGMKNFGSIRLSGNMSDHPNKTDYEKTLNRQSRACGCDSSAKGLLIGLFASGVFEIFRFATMENSVGNAAITILATTVLFAVAGKAYGLVKANSKLKRTVSEIQKEWRPEKEFSEGILCG
jgi:hypothetical protein